MNQPQPVSPVSQCSPSEMQVHSRLYGRQPRGEPSGAPEAGVLVGILQGEEPCLLYTVRAADMSSHAGEVAFPGGKKEQSDADIWDTALRESMEEVGLDIEGLTRIGQLDRIVSRFGIEVTPCVALLPEQHGWEIASAEIAEVFTVPISRLLYEPPLATDSFRKGDMQVQMPRWPGREGKEIWGLTARITAEFLCYAYDDNRNLCHPEIVIQ